MSHKFLSAVLPCTTILIVYFFYFVVDPPLIISWRGSVARLPKVGNQVSECFWVSCVSHEVVFWNSVQIITSNIFQRKVNEAIFEFLDRWEGSNHKTV